MRMLLEIFNSYDKKQTGLIEVPFVSDILAKLDKPINNWQDFIPKVTMTKEGYLTFDEFLALLTELEAFYNKSTTNTGDSNVERTQKIHIAPDPKVLEFLKLLDD